MSNKEQIDYLLLDIRELESQVASMRDEDKLPMRVLAESCSQAFKIIEKLNHLESEQIQQIGNQMAEQQEELMRLSLLLERYQHSAKKCKADIQELKEQENTPAPAPIAEPIIEPIAVRPIPAASIDAVSHSLSEILEKKNLSDFRKAFSLNDRFRFRRELFTGDESRMNKAIADLNEIHTYEESVTYLNNELKWNIEDAAVADFIKLLEKRFL